MSIVGAILAVFIIFMLSVRIDQLEKECRHWKAIAQTGYEVMKANETEEEVSDGDEQR